MARTSTRRQRTPSAPTVIPARDHPGTERWPVKTGGDSQAASISLATPIKATVAEMRVLPPPRDPDTLTARDAPVEIHAYEITATLVRAHPETDGDYHLVIQDGTSTMIAEIPNPAFVPSTSPWLGQIRTSRAAFDAAFGPLTGKITPNRQITICGPGLFDKLHNQDGVAPSGIEIHPVLSLTVR